MIRRCEGRVGSRCRAARLMCGGRLRTSPPPLICIMRPSSSNLRFCFSPNLTNGHLQKKKTTDNCSPPRLNPARLYGQDVRFCTRALRARYPAATLQRFPPLPSPQPGVEDAELDSRHADCWTHCSCFGNNTSQRCSDACDRFAPKCEFYQTGRRLSSVISITTTSFAVQRLVVCGRSKVQTFTIIFLL